MTDSENEDLSSYATEEEIVTEEEFSTEMYKKWFKSGTQQGFLSLVPWVEGADGPGPGKISVDIGQLDAGKLSSHTLVWANIIELATYLDAVYNGTAAKIYYANPKAGLPTPESFAYYGGSEKGGEVVSRILKIHHWTTGEGDSTKVESNAFAWKTGHFRGRRSSTGAFIPDMKSPICHNTIKVSRKEMAEINYRIKLTLSGYAARHKEWFNWKKK